MLARSIFAAGLLLVLGVQALPGTIPTSNHDTGVWSGSDSDSGYGSGSDSGHWSDSDSGYYSDSDSDYDSDSGSDYYSDSESGYRSDSDDSAYSSDTDWSYYSDSSWDSGSDVSDVSDDNDDSDEGDDSDDSDNSDDGSGGGGQPGSGGGRDNSDHDPGSHNATFEALLAAAVLEYADDPLFFEAQRLADPSFGPVPGQDPLFSSYMGLDPPWPGNITHPILPTVPGPPHPDDRTWQNLLSAEWIIFSFYQTAVTTFPASSFAAYPPTTFSRLLEIRNNEAGHLRLFQSQISPSSIKPGACRYNFPFTSPSAFMALMTVLEISSMAFLTGLVQQPTNPAGRGAMLAIAETETRHEVWALMDVWRTNPFAGPIDTVFPYADEILGSTSSFIVPGSCPGLNPEYPTPNLRLPALSAGGETVSLAPGSRISLEFGEGPNQPRFEEGRDYFAVFFHGMGNVSIPLQTRGWPEEKIWVTIAGEFENKGVVVAVVADQEGAPTKESLVAGPAVILEQPGEVGLALLVGEGKGKGKGKGKGTGKGKGGRPPGAGGMGRGPAS